jgi:hypothetical protein
MNIFLGLGLLAAGIVGIGTFYAQNTVLFLISVVATLAGICVLAGVRSFD